jgi:hypothetical protein
MSMNFASLMEYIIPKLTKISMIYNLNAIVFMVNIEFAALATRLYLVRKKSNFRFHC